jgi:hypothetical protein
MPCLDTKKNRIFFVGLLLKQIIIKVHGWTTLEHDDF